MYDPHTLPDNILTTNLKRVVNFARRSSLWPMPFATACCGIELMATASSRYDLSRFGAEAMRFSPRQSDLMIVAGRVTIKMLPVLQHIYQQIGYQCLRVSSTESKGIEALKQLMVGKVSMFSGHSGVGKSTLVNALEPSLHLKTKTISEQSKQGQHTTTFAEMYDLSLNAKIIDTPGIKGFGIVDLE